MSSLDIIVEKILEEGRVKVEKLMSEAREEAQGTLEERRNRALEERDVLVERAEREAEQLKEKAISNAQLRTRDEILKAKQTVVERVFDQAVERLLSLKDKDYVDFVKGRLSAMNLGKDATLLVPKDKVKLLEDAQLGFPVKEGDLESGFAVADGHLLLNNDFRGLVDVIKDEFEGDIVKKLFAK